MGRNHSEDCCESGPGYATPLLAMSGPREKLIYVAAIYTGTFALYIYISIVELKI